MDRREFIAAAGTAAALTSTSKAFAEAAGGGEMEEPMHPPNYKALEESINQFIDWSTYSLTSLFVSDSLMT